MPKPGDRVKISTIDEVLEGILMPNEETDTVVIKLDNGYNVGIDKKKIKKIDVIEEYKMIKVKEEKILKKNPKLPNITILHTGGTIASKVDYKTGGVVARFSPVELVAMFPELKKIANIESKLIANMWSDDLRVEHFGVIAKAVKEEYSNGAAGVIIGMGTDNIAVGAAALAFIIEKCPIPVLFVGAQRSSDRGSSDAGTNLICAASFIAKSDFAGVALCMHASSADTKCVILPACKTRKLHTSRRDAFKPVNDTAIAEVDYKTGKIMFIKKDYPKKKEDEMIIKPKMETKVGLIKISINMYPEQFEPYKKFKGVVIEGTGLGHTPGDVIDDITKVHAKIKKLLKDITEKSVVVMTSTCLFGRVGMNVYSKGRDLQALGIISGEDMLPETALVKLSWLLGNYSVKEAKELIAKNLRGEISDRTEVKEKFI
ncbi:Glu-tRNA(Gln) amidotransferase GatDE subunit D [Candidatus Woesearchaeota archaeon]|nr:MAG: Glu-tRNA(Gln) amidotransferase GatDE subunit D [Candidatus Woesearchaeota archaeon]